MKPYRKNLLIGAFAIIGTALTGLITPYLHMIAINDIITPAAQTGNASYMAAFKWWVPLFVLVTGANYAFQYIQTYEMRFVGEKSVQKIKNEWVEKLQEISLKYFSEGETGRIMSRPTTDSQQVRIFMRMGLTTMIMDAAQIIGSLLIIFFLTGGWHCSPFRSCPCSYSFVVPWRLVEKAVPPDTDQSGRVRRQDAGKHRRDENYQGICQRR